MLSVLRAGLKSGQEVGLMVSLQRMPISLSRGVSGLGDGDFFQ